MIANLRPYPSMKESAVKWLGKVPEHWTEKRAKYFYRESDELSESGDEELMSVSHKTGVTPRKSGVTMFLAESTVGYKICRPDDVAINTMWAFMGALGIARQVGIVSPSYGVYRPKQESDLLPEYADRLLRIDAYKAEYMCRSTGINSSRLRLYPDDFLRIPILCPPLSEQASIVRYLHHMDLRVRRLVKAKRKLIALLNEQKQSIIHRAVTHGLDPDAPLKDSGIEWLGKIPQHWEIVSLKRILSQLIDCEHKTAPAVDNSNLRVVRTSAVRNGTYNRSGTYGTSPEAYAEWTKRGTPEAGDVIFTREAPAGEACVVPEGEVICLGQRTVLMKIKPTEYSAKFLVHMIYGGPPRHRIKLASQGSTVGHFNMDDIGWMRIYKPPLSEQHKIVEHLEEATKEIDTTINLAKQEIVLFNEYRTRLISDVVTGKLDVRDAASTLQEIYPLSEDDVTDVDFDIEADLDEFNEDLVEVEA